MTDAETEDDSMTEFEASVYAEFVSQYETLGIEQAFREAELTDLQSNTYEFPVPSDPDTAVTPQQEGETIPRSGTDYERATVRFEKFGFEVGDDVDQETLQDRIDHCYATLASVAVEEIYDSVPCTWVSNDNRLDIIEDAIIESGQTLTYGEQDTVILPAVLAEAIANDDPTREFDEIASDLEDEFDVQIVVDEYNVLRSGDVLVVNTDRFGYDCVRTKPTTSQYVEYDEHDPRREIHIPEDERTVVQEIVQAYCRKGYTVLKPDEAHVVRFGQV